MFAVLSELQVSRGIASRDMIGKDSGSLDVELFLLLFDFRLSSRRRALGWPLRLAAE